MSFIFSYNLGMIKREKMKEGGRYEYVVNKSSDSHVLDD